MIVPLKYPLGVLPVFPSEEYKMIGVFFILVLLDKDGPVRVRYEFFRFFFILFNYIYTSDCAKGTRDLLDSNS